MSISATSSFSAWGAISVSILLSEMGWPLYLAALGGGVLSVVVASLIGAAVLRLRGAYFALATIGVNEAARAFVSNFEPFGGSTGLYVNFSAYDQLRRGRPGPLVDLHPPVARHHGPVVVASYLVKHSRFGLGLIAIREDEDAAMVMGVKAPWAKTKAFALSAFFPALIGTLYFFKNGNVEPEDAFRFQMSLEILVMVMLGGKGLVLGPILGAFAYERLRGYLLISPIFKNLHLALSGGILLLIVLFVPGGAVGWLRERFPRLRRLDGMILQVQGSLQDASAASRP